MKGILTHLRGAVRFDRNEWSGAFGDIGTDFPLVVGMIMVGGLDPASTLILFGVMQLFAGLFYGIPMPAQPLKAMAVVVIAGGVSGKVLAGGGLAVGLVMLFLVATGLIDVLAKAIPKCVIRGIQFGLGLKLASLALNYVQGKKMPGFQPDGTVAGTVLGGVAFVITIGLLSNRKYPAALIVIVLGILYAFLFKTDAGLLGRSIGFALPQRPEIPGWADIWTGFLVLGLAQIPLSLGNSILATEQLAADLFPEKKITVKKIGLTYSIMNLVTPLFGGIPTCHGSGGMAGHHAFGGRTGGSVVIYGLFYLVMGFFFSSGFHDVLQLFPLPILGVILMFEGFFLMRLIRDMAEQKELFAVVLLVGIVAFSVPKYGFLVGMVVGTLLAYLVKRKAIRLGGG